MLFMMISLWLFDLFKVLCDFIIENGVGVLQVHQTVR